MLIQISHWHCIDCVCFEALGDHNLRSKGIAIQNEPKLAEGKVQKQHQEILSDKTKLFLYPPSPSSSVFFNRREVMHSQSFRNLPAQSHKLSMRYATCLCSWGLKTQAYRSKHINKSNTALQVPLSFHNYMFACCSHTQSHSIPSHAV